MSIRNSIFFGFGCLSILFLGCEHHELTDPELVRFARAKEAQARAIVREQDLKMPKEGWRLFRAVLKDDWNTATNLFDRLQAKRSVPSGIPALPGQLQPAL